MGAAKSILSKSVNRIGRNWNVENRARRAINPERHVESPRYPTEARIIAEQKARNPVPPSSIPGLETEKNPALDDWLKKVKVYSRDVPVDFNNPVEHDPRKGSSEKSLPQDREPPVLDEYGYNPDIRTPPGKIHMKHCLELLSLHQQDPLVNTPAALAAKYNVRDEDVLALVNHFAVFALFVPEKAGNEARVVDMKEHFLSAPKVSQLLERSVPEFRAWGMGPNSYKLFLQQKDQLAREAEMLKEAAEKNLPPPDIGLRANEDVEIKVEKVEDRVRRPDRRRTSS